MKRKEILFNEKAKAKILSGLKKAEQAVGSTLGPAGNTVLIQSEYQTMGMTTTKDGVTVMSHIILEDNAEDLPVRQMRQAATQTVAQAGDGTTTSIVLAESMIRNAIERMGDHNNVTTVAAYMNEVAESTVGKLKDQSVSVSDNKDELKYVATVSVNNDEELGDIIANAYKEVGDDGVVTVEGSKTPETHHKVTKGIKFKRGWMSRFHVNNPKNGTAELDNPIILVTDLKIPSVKSIEKFLKQAVEENRPLLIIGELEMEAQQTIDHNIVKKVLKGAFVMPPSFGIRKEDQMDDIALAVGADFITHKTGSSWNAIKLTAAGTAHKVIISQSETTILSKDGDIKEEVIDRISDLKDQLKKETNEHEREALQERIANLSGKVATVYVGAKTEGELKEKRDRVEDAVLATRAALEQGILPGGGIALLKQVSNPFKTKSWTQRLAGILFKKKTGDYQLAKEIMAEAFKSPFNKIMTNAGKDPSLVYSEYDLDTSWERGYDVKNNTIGNMLDLGIIDPTKITCSALMNATSVATTLMKTDTIIIDAKEDESKG